MNRRCTRVDEYAQAIREGRLKVPSTNERVTPAPGGIDVEQQTEELDVQLSPTIKGQSEG
jgi:hypothetical protein